jgi:methionyl-tRNA formyltransferase
MKQSPKIVFFGNERLATAVTTTAPTLRAILEAGYEVAAVVINNETATSRKSRQLEIGAVAAEHDLPVLTPAKPADIAEQLQAYEADIGILVAYGKIVPQSIIDTFPRGIVNIHPSLLPKHRGPTPIESIILSGETESGVSLMQLQREMDAGPVYAQRTTSVPADISKQALADHMLQIGSEMLIQHLPGILGGELIPSSQDDNIATYDALLSKTDGIIDWTKPATLLEREIRAYAGWPKSLASFGNHQLIITEAAVVNTSGEAGNYVIEDKSLTVHCGVDSLRIHRVQPLNKKEMPIKAFLSGYKL